MRVYSDSFLTCPIFFYDYYWFSN